ncbi:MAG TPA: hypothetical protein VGW38_17555 [Chloroflexota bacterium]|nr:hypothetical protein [Chloroflexota bacterium]
MGALGRRGEELVKSPGALSALGQEAGIEDADEAVPGMGAQPHEDQVEGHPVEGPAEVAPEGLFSEATEASHIGEGGSALPRKDDAEELREELPLVFADRAVENGRHLCEDDLEHRRENRGCGHRSWSLLGGTTELRPIAFSRKTAQN